MSTPALAVPLPRPATYVIAESALGAVLVAATERGVCAILMDDDPARLVGELHRRFPAAEPAAAGDGRLGDLAFRAVRLVEGAGGDAIPLDPRGTAFERRVWSAIADIPPGSVVTYAELASRIGAPGSARAVARACASNLLAVAIPCHRVVRSDDDLAGYRWGLTRKRELLAREAAA
ncbi:MAG TPA: methylated-DNA--[protein]-cysteine S-methyltransferase [Gemmatimonadales bacterium]|nr:methylated-DNA--[protein]-cysteine S-methyltransferase [Gemmatimonadales bacterium]